MDVHELCEHLDRRLDRVERTLVYLTEVIVKMAKDQADFDAVLTAFLAEVESYQNDVTQVLAVISTKAPGVDLSTEVAQINASKASLDAAVAAVQGALTPAVPADPGEPAPADGSGTGDGSVPVDPATGSTVDGGSGSADAGASGSADAGSSSDAGAAPADASSAEPSA